MYHAKASKTDLYVTKKSRGGTIQVKLASERIARMLHMPARASGRTLCPLTPQRKRFSGSNVKRREEEYEN